MKEIISQKLPQQKRARIKENLEAWVKEPSNLLYRLIRAYAAKNVDSVGSSFTAHGSQEIARAALAGYEDIFEVFDRDGEARILIK